MSMLRFEISRWRAQLNGRSSRKRAVRARNFETVFQNFVFAVSREIIPLNHYLSYCYREPQPCLIYSTSFGLASKAALNFSRDSGRFSYKMDRQLYRPFIPREISLTGSVFVRASLSIDT